MRAVSPKLGSLAQVSYTRKTPDYLALKASKVYIRETQRAVSNSDSILKGNTQNFTWSGIQGKNRNLKRQDQSYQLILESPGKAIDSSSP